MFQAALQAWTNVWLPSGALAIEETERVAFTAESLEVRFFRGHRSVGGFVGSHAMRDRWVEPMVADWVKGVEALARVARKYPQSAYVVFTQSLQAECQRSLPLCPRCWPALGSYGGGYQG